MSYEKQTWTTGEVITAEKLNHMEDGIAGAGGSTIEPITITITYDSDTETYTANKTYLDFNAEWANWVDESTDLDENRAACTITLDEGEDSVTVYNGLAVLAPLQDTLGLGLITYLSGGVEYKEGEGYIYTKLASGFIFYQHGADDVIIEM